MGTNAAQVRFLFVGQRPSKRAEQIGATWANGKLAASTLWAALRALGLNPADQTFRNIWHTAEPVSASAEAAAEAASLVVIRDYALSGWLIIGMGAVVHAWLDRHDVPFTKLTHPAARGAIRRQERYQRHVRQVLGPLLGLGEVAA